MNYQLILLNNPSRHNFSKGLSSFVCMPKQGFASITQHSTSVLAAPQLIVMQANSDSLEYDLALLNFLKANPVFKHVSVLVFTLERAAAETIHYFEHGAATCMLMPVAPEEWVNIIHYIPAYWLDAA